MSADTVKLYPSSYPFQDLLGFRKTEFRQDFARFELDLEPRHTNRAGLPHGGVYAALLDAALGSSGCYIGKDDDFRPGVTLNLNISYLAAARGTRIIAEGRRIGGGRSIFFSEGQIIDETGTVLATASGTFKYTDNTRPAKRTDG